MTTEKGVLVSKPLTMGAVAQITDKNLYVASDVFPTVLVDSIKGTYKYFNKEDLAKYQAELRKPGASYKNVTLDISEQAYLCKGYGLKYTLPIEHEEELGGSIMQTGANYLYDQGLRTLEYQFALTYLKTGVWGTDFSPTNKWNATSGTNPIAEFKTAKKTIRQNGKAIAQYAVMTEDVFDALCENENIMDRLAVDTFRAIGTEEKLAEILGLKKIYVIRETDVTEICVVFAKNEMAPAENPNAGLIVIRNYAHEVKDAKGIGITNPYFDEDVDSEVIKLKLRFDMIIPAKDLGYCFNNVLS